MVSFFAILYKIIRFCVLLQIIKYLYINFNQWNNMNELFWYLSLLFLDLWLTNNAIYLENKQNDEES